MTLSVGPTTMAEPGAVPTRCRICAGQLSRSFAVCFCCDTLVGQLQVPLVPMVAMVEYRLGDRMHRRLRGYKDAPVAEARDRYRDELVMWAARWLHHHQRHLGRRFKSDWNAVATVPSSSRPGRDPVEAIVARVPALGALHRPLLIRGRGCTGHLQASRLGFELAPGVDQHRLRSLRVLLVDDSVVTGARAQSAAASLQLGGAQVVGVLALGRSVARRDSAPPAGPHG